MFRFGWLCRSALVAGVALVAAAGAAAQVGLEAGGRVYLHKDWEIQSSCVAKATGEQISAVGFDASNVAQE